MPQASASTSAGVSEFKLHGELKTSSRCSLNKPKEIKTSLYQMGSHRNNNRKSTDIYANLERITKAKTVAEQAIKDKKVFRIDGGHRYIRLALKNRGWVEKFTPKTKKFSCGSEDSPPAEPDGLTEDHPKDLATSHLPIDDFDQLVSRALKDHTPDLQFVPLHRIEFNGLSQSALVNHFPKTNFVTKTGLTDCLRDVQWVSDRSADQFYPKCFILGDADDNEAFRDHFRRCCVTSFLKLCLKQFNSSSTEIDDDTLNIDSEWINFALESYNSNYNDSFSVHSEASTLAAQTSLDLEDEINQKQWSNFISVFYLVAYKHHFVPGLRPFIPLIQTALKNYEENNPQAFIEGDQNLWIIKPGAMSRGRGIGVYCNLKEIVDLLGPDLTVIANNKWVAQKYIERPLLVNRVKFDIRQWFMVTDWNQMTIWMYDRSYIRFASTPFSLVNLDTQIHLTNNAIQKNFELDDDIRDDIPDEKMWFAEEMAEHLKSLGHGNVWEEKIKPAMRKILIEACKAGQDTAESRKNSFELYGADFMLDENLNPWLIEINQGPCMSIKTAVTDELVQEMFEDMCKVVLDRKGNHKKESKPSTPDTGNFTQIFRQPTVECPRYVGNFLNVEGKGLGYLKPKPKLKTYIKTLPKPKENKDGENSSAYSEVEEVEFEQRVYSWDIDRINRLAQPRYIADRASQPNKEQINPKQSLSKLSNTSTHNILKKLKEISNKSDNKPNESKSATRKLGQPSSARKYKTNRPRPITSKSQQDDSDINPTEVKVEVTDVNIQDKKNEIAKQIANDLQLARNRVESMIKPVRAAESKTIEHRILYPFGLTESRFKVQNRVKGKDSSLVSSRVRAYRQIKNLPQFEMLAHSKVIQTRCGSSKTSLSPTVFPFSETGFPPMGDKGPFQPLPVIMPLTLCYPLTDLVLPSQPKYLRGVPTYTKSSQQKHSIRIPL